MAEIVFNFEQYDGQIAKSCMDRLRKAGAVIRDAAKNKCVVGTISRPAPDGGKVWMEREPGALKETIRLAEKTGEKGLEGRDVRIIAGNYKTWYATQVEFGRGGWKGGAHPFLRPAMRSTKNEVQSILENG